MDGNSIHYAREDVTLTYQPPTAPGSAGAERLRRLQHRRSLPLHHVQRHRLRRPPEHRFAVVPVGEHQQPARPARLRPGDQIRAADNEGGWWAEGIWSSFGVRGKQWKMAPHGILYNLSTTNITYLNVCIKQNDLEY